MRRWVIWIAGSIVGAALAFVGLAVLLGKSDQPFDFLAGLEPMPLPASDQRDMEADGTFYAYYSFQDAKLETVRRALLELQDQGFVEVTKHLPASLARRQRHFVRGDADNYVRWLESTSWSSIPSSAPDVENVVIEPGMQVRILRRDSEEFLFWVTTRGWVSVTVGGRRPDGIFDRFRRWLGL